MAWFPKQHVIVPVDFSDVSFTAVDTAIQHVEDPSHVTVLHVLEDALPIQVGASWNSLDRLTKVQHTLHELQKRLKERGREDVSVDVRTGHAVHEIIEVAEHQKADLIVLTSHGHSGLQRLLIGSVAERVTRLSHCPVLILRS